MALKEVLMLGNPELRQESSPVSQFGQDLARIIKDLKDTLLSLQEEKEIGRALAAPQIGYKQKVVYANLPEEEIIMVNPDIVWYSEEEFEVWDSCFSFDVAFFVKVKRAREIIVHYQNTAGIDIERTFSGGLSELFQHEIDHLQGRLATDLLVDNESIMMRSEWEGRQQ
ncbi:MAG: peptide deformylase [Bacillota bacterium]